MAETSKKSTKKKAAKKSAEPAAQPTAVKKSPAKKAAASKPAPKKAAPKKAAPKKKAVAKKAAPTKAAPIANTTAPREVTARERWNMIATAAYYLAERRGFQGGDPAQDWTEAERQIDEQLVREGIVVTE